MRKNYFFKQCATSASLQYCQENYTKTATEFFSFFFNAILSTVGWNFAVRNRAVSYGKTRVRQWHKMKITSLIWFLAFQLKSKRQKRGCLIKNASKTRKQRTWLSMSVIQLVVVVKFEFEYRGKSSLLEVLAVSAHQCSKGIRKNDYGLFLRSFTGKKLVSGTSVDDMLSS